jgi:hypothetical protein
MSSDYAMRRRAAPARVAEAAPAQPMAQARTPLTAMQAALDATPRVQDLLATRAALSRQPGPVQLAAPAPNRTGLPDRLKAGIEAASGLSMDATRVRYNSAEPAQLNAHAFARGSDIHIAPGQERHLPHEAWHVVQQAQGRVRPTAVMPAGVALNDDQGLEREADIMGAQALQRMPSADLAPAPTPSGAGGAPVVQRAIGFELQSTWLIKQIGTNKRPDSKDVAYEGDWFQVEVDKVGGSAELEIVSDPLESHDDLQACLVEVKALVGQLAAATGTTFRMQGSGWVQPTKIERKSNGAPIFKMQATEGVTIERIPELIQAWHPDAWQEIGASPGGTEHTGKLGGLVAAIGLFLSDSLLYRQARASDDVKYAFRLMQRTDFHSVYLALDDTEKQTFRDMIAGDEFLGVATAGRVFPKYKFHGKFVVATTIGEWLASIVAGRPQIEPDSDGDLEEVDGTEPKDLMSPPSPLNPHHAVDTWNARNPNDQKMKHAMGQYGIVDGRVLFEIRDLPGGQQNVAAHAEYLLEKFGPAAIGRGSLEPAAEDDDGAVADTDGGAAGDEVMGQGAIEQPDLELGDAIAQDVAKDEDSAMET